MAPDSAARFGKLPNGLRYVVRSNGEPRNRASLRLVVLAGSFMEMEYQRGLAHFLEHLAFNGSRHYPKGTLVATLQRLGMSFGADTNAYTGFDRTVYQLELPDTRAATLTEGFRIFGDYAAALDLSPDMIEKERGIVLAEKRAADSVSFRTLLAEMSFALGGTLIPDRLPIGSEEVIKHAPRAAILDYYQTWYRPDRMAVVAVGDFDTAKVEQQIIECFSSLEPRGPERANPDLGNLLVPDGVRVKHHFEPEAGSTRVSLSTISPVSFEPDNSANRLKNLPRTLAIAMLNRRFAILARKEGAPISSAQAAVVRQYDLYRQASMEAFCNPEKWKDALCAIEQELRRALEHGFLPAELKEAKAIFQNNLEEVVASASTRGSGALADQITGAIVAREVFTTPAAVLALYKPALEHLTVEDCAAALRALWNVPGRNIFVSGNLPLSTDAIAIITDTYARSCSMAVTAPVNAVEQSFAYGDFGPPGNVVWRQEMADLGVTLIKFSNGVRLNVKKTDFEKHRVYINVRFGAGHLSEPRGKSGLNVLTSAIFTAGGLGKHSVDELQPILAGKTVSLSFGVGPDAFNIQGYTNRDDLLIECQFLTAFLADPGFRPEALRQATQGFEQKYAQLEHSLDEPVMTIIARRLAGDDSRFGLPTKEVQLSRTVEEVKEWLAPQLASGAIEVSVVGDLDINATIAIIARTFGALPEREPKPAFTAERLIKLPQRPITEEYRVDTRIPKGLTKLYWPATDAFDAPLSRRLNMLTTVFRDRLRLRLREQMGEAYSPSASAYLSDTYPGYGFLSASVTIEPGKAQIAAQSIKAVAADLATNGVTEDELLRAKQPILTALKESQRTNSYWLNTVLASAQEYPQKLEWSRTRVTDTEAITAAELSALAARYLPPERASQFIILPEVSSK